MIASGSPAAGRPRVALAHDYLTQRGGAERVAGIMAGAFPEAPLYTTLYEPRTTFAEFADLDLRVSALNRIPVLRRDHRLALPVLAAAVARMRVDADVLLASSSGWAHGIACTGRTVVYCHAPARWLYQSARYLGPASGLSLPGRVRRTAMAAAVAALGAPLRRWDRRAAARADRYLVNSTVVRRMVAEVYGIDAEVLPPPPALLPDGEVSEVPGLPDRPFVLCVARLLPYKNVAEVIGAVLELPDLDLVVVGRGPDHDRLAGIAGGSPRIHLLGSVGDPELRWLYGRSAGLVAASYEDYGLSPLEAAAFGKPTAALRDGGFLDTIDDTVNGVFFAEPEPHGIAAALRLLLARDWDATRIAAHAERFSRARFVARLHDVVADELR